MQKGKIKIDNISPKSEELHNFRLRKSLKTNKDCIIKNDKIDSNTKSKTPTKSTVGKRKKKQCDSPTIKTTRSYCKVQNDIDNKKGSKQNMPTTKTIELKALS